MAFSIKNDEADRLVRELTALTGESLTTAVRESVRERLDRVARQHLPGDRSGVEAILDYGRRLRDHPVLDDRTSDEIIGYDEHGLPS